MQALGLWGQFTGGTQTLRWGIAGLFSRLSHTGDVGCANGGLGNCLDFQVQTSARPYSCKEFVHFKVEALRLRSQLGRRALHLNSGLARLFGGLGNA